MRSERRRIGLLRESLGLGSTFRVDLRLHSPAVLMIVRSALFEGQGVFLLEAGSALRACLLQRDVEPRADRSDHPRPSSIARLNDAAAACGLTRNIPIGRR